MRVWKGYQKYIGSPISNWQSYFNKKISIVWIVWAESLNPTSQKSAVAKMLGQKSAVSKNEAISRQSVNPIDTLFC